MSCSCTRCTGLGARCPFCPLGEHTWPLAVHKTRFWLAWCCTITSFQAEAGFHLDIAMVLVAPHSWYTDGCSSYCTKSCHFSHMCSKEMYISQTATEFFKETSFQVSIIHRNGSQRCLSLQSVLQQLDCFPISFPPSQWAVTLFHIQASFHLLHNSYWTAWPLKRDQYVVPQVFKALIHIIASWHSKFVPSPLKSLAFGFCILLEENSIRSTKGDW